MYSVFKAVADPTRRDILQLLAVEERPFTINDIADQFPTSRQAVTKHLKLLQQAGLVEIERNGRERVCHANPLPLQEIHAWVTQYEQFWTDKLAALGDYLNEKQKTENGKQ